MIQHVWSVLCQSASFDSQSNFVSLLNVLEGISIVGTPTKERPFALSCELISLWVRPYPDIPEVGQMRVTFFSPGGKDEKSTILDLDLSNSLFHRTRITLPNLAFVSPGRYEFKVEYKSAAEEQWHPAAQIPFIITTQEPSPSPVENNLSAPKNED